MKKDAKPIYTLQDYDGVFGSVPLLGEGRILEVDARFSTAALEAAALGRLWTAGDATYGAPVVDMLHHIEHHLDILGEACVADAARCAIQLSVFRERAMAFLADYGDGQVMSRYVALPKGDGRLPFADHAFDSVWVRDWALNFSPARFMEWCRVGLDVRLYPILDETGNVADVLGPVLADLQAQNLGMEIMMVAHPKTQVPNALLRVWSKACVLSG
ncbi:MAG: hypothetical protein A3J38_01855 [Gammaproteobacteria bacterium RIFCSPHIGHO2_12_FULL_45_9]|nr:MAG: hypothetical protein A3J38_01855 [Gammaproteobacteria bacterium RIFCSPHIGHO2_12_FULL_45_9]